MSTRRRRNNRRSSDVLLMGVGNPGRCDDGLGPALAKAVEQMAIPGVTAEADYQLRVEDAVTLARHDLVVFVDADAVCTEPFSCRRVKPAIRSLTFTSHSIEPAHLLGLTKELFGRAPKAYLLGIRGYEFDRFDDSLSKKASENLRKALRFVKRQLLGSPPHARFAPHLVDEPK